MTRKISALVVLSLFLVTLISWAGQPILSAPGCDDASATVRGCVTTTTQSFAGAKTFTGAVLLEASGNALEFTGGGVITNSTPASSVTIQDTNGLSVQGNGGTGWGSVEAGAFTAQGGAPQFSSALSTASMTFSGAISAATASSTVAAFTFTPTTALNANDLLLNVEKSDGTNMFTVDVEGDIAAAGISSTLGRATFSGSVATSWSVGAYGGGLNGAFHGQNSTAAADVLTFAQDGVGTTGGIDADGTFNGLAVKNYVATNTLSVTSITNDATTSGTVGAITLKANSDIDAADLVLDVQDSAANHLFGVYESGGVSMGSSTLFQLYANYDLISGFNFTDNGPFNTWVDGFSAGQTMPEASIAIVNTTVQGDVLWGIMQGTSIPSATYRVTMQGDGSYCMNGASGAAYSTCTDKLQSSNAGTQTMALISAALDATTSSTVGAITLKSNVDIASSDLVLDVQDSAGAHLLTLTEAGVLRNLSPTSLLTSVFVGAVTVASTNYGGDVLPAAAFTVTSATMRTSAAGSGGTSNFAFRISDGTNHCDCTMACNAVAGNKSLTCAGAGGSGCALPASASLTYSVNSIGDCSAGPTVVGNVQVRGYWTP